MPDEMIFSKAPAGIKFALGENVKQSNWGDKKTTRFPQTRMGVKTFFINRFTGGPSIPGRATCHRYRVRRCGGIWNWTRSGEILKGERLIHCHSYRQDEMLVFLRTMERFGIRVGSLQHVLEGYKIADEIAAHGAGASILRIGGLINSKCTMRFLITAPCSMSVAQWSALIQIHPIWRGASIWNRLKRLNTEAHQRLRR